MNADELLGLPIEDIIADPDNTRKTAPDDELPSFRRAF